MSRIARRHGPSGLDRALRATAIAFACATAHNSVIAVQASVPGEPLGIRTRMSVATEILVGWGSAVAAPWPMAAAAVVAAGRRPGSDGTSRSAMVCAGIGIAGIVGILIEPNTYTPRHWTPGVRRAVVAHVATCSALGLVGTAALRRSRRAGARAAGRA